MWLSKQEIRVENGKAHVEFTFDFETAIMEEQDELQVTIYDADMHEVLICGHPMSLAQPVKGMILHPHLWNSIQDPYCYTLRATLYRAERGKCMVVESMEEIFPIYTLEERGQRGWYLNDHPFSMRGVTYTDFLNVNGEIPSWIKEDMREICRLGANVIYAEKINAKLSTVAYEMGLLLGEQQEIQKENMLGLVLPRDWNTDGYYYYFAKWSNIPFLHMSISSLQFEEDGTCSFTVYSNQKRVALYCDGILFEFKGEPPEFYFEHVPVTDPLLLTLETQERTVSVSLYPTAEAKR